MSLLTPDTCTKKYMSQRPHLLIFRGRKKQQFTFRGLRGAGGAGVMVRLDTSVFQPAVCRGSLGAAAFQLVLCSCRGGFAPPSLPSAHETAQQYWRWQGNHDGCCADHTAPAHVLGMENTCDALRVVITGVCLADLHLRLLETTHLHSRGGLSRPCQY